MKTQDGGKRKRKAETNFVDAYSGSSQLAPPPSSRDVLAVPAKLRKIMQLKASIAKGVPRNDARTGKNSGRKFIRVAKKHGAVSNVKGSGVETKSNAHEAGQNPRSSFSVKWKKAEEELKMLVGKMDKREKTGVSAGFSERRKSFFSAKKKKKKNKGKIPDADTMPPFHQYDKVAFGDTVQAPPKLAFPRKAAEIKVKEKRKGDQDLLRERLRQEAIEAYRQRKEWSSRPGGQKLPMLNLTEAEI